MMRKKDGEHKKYLPTTRPSPATHEFYDREDRFGSQDDLREQLRAALEELEHHRLTSDLEVQKRILLEQQMKTVRQEYEEQRQENEELRKEYGRLAKKYAKTKEKRGCEKCRGGEEAAASLEKEREIYLNDRKMLQDEIKSLRAQLESSEAEQEREKLGGLVESLRKELHLSGRKMEQQARVIQFMNEKLSLYEVENVQIMHNVELLENKLSEMEIDTAIRRKQDPCSACARKREEGRANASPSLGKRRKTGSIQNMRREDYGEELERYEP